MMDDERRDDLLAIFRREPDQARLLIKIGLITPPLILAWRFLADYALPRAPLDLITTLIIVAYGGVLAYLSARLIHASDQWQVESVLHSRRLLTTDKRNPWAPQSGSKNDSPEQDANAPISIAPPPPVSLPPNRFHQAEFQMRLQEEVLRARREGHEMAVVALDVTLPHDYSSAQLEKLSVEVARLIVNQQGTINAALNIGETEFMLVLPSSDRRAAKAFISKVVQAMGDYWCHYGLAVYPEDATDAQSLFEFALNECEASHQGRSRERAIAN